MPIYLPAPAPRLGGPDGRGWTRLSIASMGGLGGDECALRPLDYTHWLESYADTRHARYGGYGACVRAGQCNECPILAARSHLDAFDSRVLVRVHPEDGRPYLMSRPEDGWASGALRWSWERLARMEGWEPDGRHQDQHGGGFWLKRVGGEPS
ncbi:hypothetical protein [Streptomyces sp. Z26]|uniref:hypothetical protein n=1 Tax=Streptomyces sp. Z26 TaxID=2500177 RepID=UPI000EF14904|nr:hypothetical protein [Streptomyces sp. Z26]RLL70303.1 hypothetical protein D7M15_08880 [Streptomyces sp. Z26]